MPQILCQSAFLFWGSLPCPCSRLLSLALTRLYLPPPLPPFLLPASCFSSAPRLAAEIIILDGFVTVYRNSSDVWMYIVGSQLENEVRAGTHARVGTRGMRAPASKRGTNGRTEGEREREREPRVFISRIGGGGGGGSSSGSSFACAQSAMAVHHVAASFSPCPHPFPSLLLLSALVVSGPQPHTHPLQPLWLVSLFTLIPSFGSCSFPDGCRKELVENHTGSLHFQAILRGDKELGVAEVSV